MQEIKKRAEQLLEQITLLKEQLAIAKIDQELLEIQQEVASPDFWQDSTRAQQRVKYQSRLEARVQPWHLLTREAREIVELAELNDEALEDDLSKQLENLEKRLDKQKSQLRLNGPYDESDAILTIYSGAGGTDAQDWAQMLLRMYMRWAERQGFDIKMLDESAGEEAGLKSATLAVSGNYVYGKLKGEHGVHRLVRLSPFNADNLRQTSFAKVDVLPRIDEPEQLIIDDKDLKIDVYRSSGKGGQSVNTTDSAVRITHLPTGITVAIQNERSQLQNKETALTILRSKLVQLQMEQHAVKISELKGANEQAAWGNQIRSYVLHPYKQVKDLRTRHETSNVDSVLDGELEPFIDAYLDQQMGSQIDKA